MQRLREREQARHGARIGPGGDMADASRAFLDWAARYETAGTDIRSRAMHDQWLGTLPCPVLRLDSQAPVDSLVAQAVAAAQ